MEVTYCFLPNAVGPPHLGHLLNLLANHELYSINSLDTGLGTDPQRARWLLCFDACSNPAVEPLYERLMDWAGCRPHDVVRLADHDTQRAIAGFVHGLGIVRELGEGLSKIAWLSVGNVRRLARAECDHMRWMSQYDLLIAKSLRLAQPTIIWTPTLLADGKVIGNAISEPYRIDFDLDDAELMVPWLKTILNERGHIEIGHDWRGQLTASTGDRATSEDPAPPDTSEDSPQPEPVPDVAIDDPENRTMPTPY
jgi:hypothetical protein